jgi:hypothetical protein
MSEQSQDSSRGAGVKLDLTINVPTMLSIIGTVAGAIIYINGQFTSINNQQLLTVGDVKVLQTQVQTQAIQLTTLRADTSGNLTSFRSEIRADLKDIKDSVDRLNQRNNGR